MKKILISILAVLCLSAFAVSDNSKKIFKKLYALDGLWKMKTKRGAICEEWKKVNKNYLQNKGFMINGADTIITERVALQRSKNDIFYTSIVEDQNNKKPIVFTLIKAEGNTFVFENQQHDFPKRIVYEIITEDSLHAFIDDGIDGSKKRQNFYYKKEK
jgi:Domain of unknown function (DUF6265)